MADGQTIPISNDPYAEFGGKSISTSAADPYAEFGGRTIPPPLNLGPSTNQSLPMAETINPGQVMKGIGEGAVQTAVGAGELAKKVGIPGANFIPDSVLQKGRDIAKPESMGEQGGKILEEGIEWTVGEGALVDSLKTLGKVAHFSPEIMELIEKSPTASKTILGLLKETAAQAAKGAVVGGGQSAVKAAGAGEAVVPALEGGALGGAVAGGASAAVEGVAGEVGKKVGIGTTSLEDVQKALQFGKNDAAALRDAELALPTIGQKFRADGKPKDMADAFKKINEVKNEHWNSKVAGPTQQLANDIPVDPATNQPVNQDTIRQEIEKRVTPVIQQLFPKRAEAIKEFASHWGSANPKTIGQINDEISQFNAELDAKDYWKATPEKRAMMEKTDPEVASYVAASDELRNVLFDHLKANGVPNIEEDRKLYGALAHIGGEVRSRINVEGRRPGMSGKEFLGIVGGAARGGPVGAAIAAAPMIEKQANKPEKVLARAAKKSLPDSTTTKVVKAARKTAVKVGEAAAGVAGEHAGKEVWVTFKDKDGHLVAAHPEDAEEAMKRNGGVKIE